MLELSCCGSPIRRQVLGMSVLDEAGGDAVFKSDLGPRENKNKAAKAVGRLSQALLIV